MVVLITESSSTALIVTLAITDCGTPLSIGLNKRIRALLKSERNSTDPRKEDLEALDGAKTISFYHCGMWFLKKIDKEPLSLSCANTKSSLVCADSIVSVCALRTK